MYGTIVYSTSYLIHMSKITGIKNNNKEEVLTQLKLGSIFLNQVSYNLRKDKDVVIAAIQHNAYALSHASHKLKDNTPQDFLNDKSFVKEVCKRHPLAAYLIKEIKNNLQYREAHSNDEATQNHDTSVPEDKNSTQDKNNEPLIKKKKQCKQ